MLVKQRVKPAADKAPAPTNTTNKSSGVRRRAGQNRALANPSGNKVDNKAQKNIAKGDKKRRKKEKEEGILRQLHLQGTRRRCGAPASVAVGS